MKACLMRRKLRAKKKAISTEKVSYCWWIWLINQARKARKEEEETGNKKDINNRS